MPRNQHPLHDNGETVHSGWWSPRQVLAAVRDGEMQMITVTERMIKCLSLFDSADEAIEAGDPNAGDIALLKVQASEVMEFCAREAMQILGGIGYMRGSRVERIYREVRVNAIGGGSEEIMRDLASRQYGL